MNEERTGKCLRQVEHIRGHYPRILFRLDMGLVYHLAHRRNDVEKIRKNMLIILFFEMHQLNKKLELYNYKQTLLQSNTFCGLNAYLLHYM